ncbi:Heat shock protein DnaJ domain protein [Devosia sp. LC5]|uniref:DnaJ domain-containing protein n=1 Tax=Devosia sp. LC5 TaxID=1502724 RepID=UPI0004E402D6|nr:DnaJ domain-containing protein [Devosia sp. LC5]KFC64506.1 Heat shock protein DnaJ domain protein [Devosia sp. LC5]
MTYVFIGGLVLLAALAAYNYLLKIERRKLMQVLRWLVGGLGILIALGLLFARRFDIALFIGAAAFAVLRTGRLGPISFEGPVGEASHISKVQSYSFVMELDHDTGAVSGRVLNGQFAGMDLMDLGEMDTRLLLAEVENDPDSISLLESWLDANRSGWREHFADQDGSENPDTGTRGDPVAEAYEVLGLKPGASRTEIRTAHRKLMKAMHPDHGGSSYLAAKINQARDLLLKQAG